MTDLTETSLAVRLCAIYESDAENLYDEQFALNLIKEYPERREGFQRLAAFVETLIAERDALPRVRHRKGGVYEVLGLAVVQTDTPLADYDVVQVYRNVDDGSLWVRPKQEFDDGRFVALSPEPSK